MRRNRGMTLIEQMVTVALIGILGVLFSALSDISERRAREELQRARAEVLATALLNEAATGVPLAAETRAKLEEGLPGVEVAQLHVLDGSAPATNAISLVVKWKSSSGLPLEVALTGLRKAGAK